MAAARNSHRDYNQAPTDIASVAVARADPAYIEKSIHRLAVLEDVPTLKTPSEIRSALNRWKHALFSGQVAAVERWLKQQVGELVTGVTL